MKKTYYLIDYLKMFFATCVVALHTGLLKNAPDNINFWVTQLIFRMAVPFFFMSSSFFLGLKIHQCALNSSSIILNYCKRLVRLLVFFDLFSFVISLLLFFCSDESLNHFCCKSLQKILFYPDGALWFIQACIVGSLMLLFFIKKQLVRISIVAGITLYVVALLGDSYFFVVKKFCMLDGIFESYLECFLTFRNGIFVGFFYMSLGYWASKIRTKCTCKDWRKQSGLLAMCSFILYVIELVFLRYVGAFPAKDDASVFLSLPIIMFFLIIFLSYYQRQASFFTMYCRNLSTGMYLLHKPMIFFWLVVLSSSHLLYTNKICLFVLVTLSSCIICIWSYKRNNWLSSFLK